ncbi:MAG TPA: MFS transporter [Ramlibacter sp.]|nr:MFS transporter [Ramlibacter sp.]
MTKTTFKWPGKLALMAGHCAGMVDLVALPVWVGTLIAHYKLDPQQAGALATLFLAAAVAASVLLAPRIARLPGRWIAAGGFAASAFAFLALSQATSYAVLAVLHALAGAAAGAALSVVHGTIGRSGQPHRLFALAGLALGVFAIAFLASTPALIQALGGPVLFKVFAGVMAVAAVIQAIAFPRTPSGAAASAKPLGKLPPAVWGGIAGIACMALLQAMMFSFVERIGVDRFGAAATAGVLIALGLVNLTPAPLAGWLEHRIAARHVLLAGAVAQAVVASVIAQSNAFAPYAVATSVFAAVMIFTHTFAFGLLSRLDPSGRAVAATPAMIMVGAAIGPVAGGTLVKLFGYGSLAAAAVVIAAIAVICFLRTREPVAATASAPAPSPAAA